MNRCAGGVGRPGACGFSCLVLGRRELRGALGRLATAPRRGHGVTCAGCRPSGRVGPAARPRLNNFAPVSCMPQLQSVKMECARMPFPFGMGRGRGAGGTGLRLTQVQVRCSANVPPTTMIADKPPGAAECRLLCPLHCLFSGKRCPCPLPRGSCGRDVI